MIEYFLKGTDEPQNFGDYASILLAELFAEDLEAKDDIYDLVGSVISNYWVEQALAKKKPGAKIHFWGCGYRGDGDYDYRDHPDVVIHAVRGPKTIEALGLPKDMAYGDPAFLLPLMLPQPQYNTGKVLLVPHMYETDLTGIINDKKSIGFDAMMLPTVNNRQKLKMLIREIATAEFVMAGAMHAAIIAAAYGVPFCFFKKEHLDLPFKWEDLAQSLNIE